MGQKHGKEATTIACVATSHCVKFSEVEMKLMWSKMLGTLPELPKDTFDSALATAAVCDKDIQILTKMFILCDETGDEVVDAMKLMAAATVLIAADATHKFTMAFSFYDFTNTGKITIEDAMSAVTAMNCCAEWFGDVVMKKAEIEALVESVFDGRTEYDVADAAAAVAKSSIFTAYVERAMEPHAEEAQYAESAEVDKSSVDDAKKDAAAAVATEPVAAS